MAETTLAGAGLNAVAAPSRGAAPFADKRLRHLIDPAQDHGGFVWAILPRHGQRPLREHIRLVLRVHNKTLYDRLWSEVTLGETAAGCYVVRIRHTPPPAYGVAWQDSLLCDGVSDVKHILRTHDAAAALPMAVFEDAPASTIVPTGARLSHYFILRWRALLWAGFGLPVGHEGCT